MAYMPAEMDDEYDYEDGFMGDEDVLQSYMASADPETNTITTGQETKFQPHSLKASESTVTNHRNTASVNQKGFVQSGPFSQIKTQDLSLRNGRTNKKSSRYTKSQASSSWKPSLSSLSSSPAGGGLLAHHYLTGEDLKVAAVKGNVDLAQKCLQQGIAIDEVLQSGWTALMYACNHGKSQVVELLLKEGGDPSYHVDLYTPLMCACSTSAPVTNGLNCVKLLVEAGVDVNAMDRHHSTGLILASRLGHLDIVCYLLNKGAKVNEQDSRGWTALTWSVQRGHKEVVITLLESGADCNIQHTDRLTVKDMAAHLPTDEMLALLERRPSKSGGGGDATGLGIVTAKDQGHDPSHSILYEGDEKTKSTDLRYGELEIFLLGLDLPHLVPVFHKHLIDLYLLLDMTEQDLINAGIEQVGARKKILDASQAVHKKNWEASSLVSVHFNKRICCADAVAMIANVSKHIRYINSTVVYIRQHLRHHPWSVLHATDRASPTQLARHLTDTSKHVHILQAELSVLQTDLSQEMKNFNVEPPDLISNQKLEQIPSSRFGRYVRVGGLLITAAGLVLLWRNVVKDTDLVRTVTAWKWF